MSKKREVCYGIDGEYVDQNILSANGNVQNTEGLRQNMIFLQRNIKNVKHAVVKKMQPEKTLASPLMLPPPPQDILLYVPDRFIASDVFVRNIICVCVCAVDISLARICNIQMQITKKCKLKGV